MVDTNPILRITDGSNSVDLLSTGSGILLNDWTPSVAPLKGGGTYQQSVLSDSRQLVMANYDNAIETFNLKVHGDNQDTVIEHAQTLFRLLEAARSYWYTPFQTDPVWLVARAPNETNTRYAIIHNYKQDGLDNPYSVPFFGCADIAMDNINLVIERGHWSNVEPGTGECVAIAGSQSTAASGVVEIVGATGDDVEAKLSSTPQSHTATTVWGAGAHYEIWSGRMSNGDRYGYAVRFSAVDIPADATISSAYLVFTASKWLPDPPGGNRGLMIYGHDHDDAAQITNVAEWNAAPLATESEYWYCVLPQNKFDRISTPDIKDIVIEIFDRPGWTDGNAMQFFVEEYDCNNNLLNTYYGYDGDSDYAAELHIEYSVPTGPAAATCDNEIWVVDKSHSAVMSHVYLWDGAAYSANQVDSATIDITDDPPAVGDKCYFGATAGPFNNIIFNITQANDLINKATIVWEYWQGAPTSAWTQFGATRIIDKTDEFTGDGFLSFTFVPPRDTVNGDWVAADLNTVAPDGTPPSVTAFWIRARVTAVSGSPNVIQVGGGVENFYTVTWPFVSIGSDQVGGDIPALARVEFDSSGQRDDTPTIRHRVIAAISSDRGPFGDYSSYDFHAYLPFSDEQTPPVMSGPHNVVSEFAFVDDISAPSGRVVRYAPLADLSYKAFYVTVNSLHYFGSYRAFLRVRQDSDWDNAFKVQVFTAHNGVVYAQSNWAPTLFYSGNIDPNWQLCDLGLIDIPTGLPARTRDEGTDVEIYIHIYCFDTTPDLYLMDLILMPTDEWITDVQDLKNVATFGFSEGRSLHVDSISVPKVDLRSLTKFGGSPAYVEPIPWKTVGTQMRLPSNNGCKLWYLTARWNIAQECWISDATTTAKVRLYSAEQYLGLRGTR